MSGRNTILIVQPYVPEYRHALFSRMSQLLRDHGLELLVAAGSPWGDQALRGDTSRSESWLIPVGQRRLGTSGRCLIHKDLSSLMKEKRPRFVIVEQALKNLETYQLMGKSLLRDLKIAIWGHGRTYTEDRGPIHEATKTLITRRASWFFSYTQGGAEFVAGRGFPAERITTLRNANDSDQLKRDMRTVTEEALDTFGARNGLTPGKTALFLGGVDRRKRVEFLVEVAKQVEREVPGFVLIFGGAGAQMEMLIKQEALGAPIRTLGRLTGLDKALALRSASVLLVPEWVGLVAVDSLAAGVPIITMASSRHAPEFEYLKDNQNALITELDDQLYIDSVVALMHDSPRLRRLQAQAVVEGRNLSACGMAQRFTAGIISWVDSSA